MDNKNKTFSLKKKIYLISKLLSVLVIVIMIFGMMIYSLFFSRVTESNYDENLTKFPEFTFNSFFSGDFYEEVAKYYVDTIHGRDDFKDMTTQLRAYYGIAEEEEEFGDTTPPDHINDNNNNDNDDNDNPDNTVSNGNGDNSNTDTPSKDPGGETSTPPLAEELCGGVVILGTRAMEVYYGNQNNAKTYAQYVNAYAQQLGNDVNIYSMVIPKPCAYYIHDSKKYPDAWKYTVDDLNTIKDSLVGVKEVDVYNALLPHKDEEIYFRTDHHWTGLGAYYATQAFTQVAGVPFANLSTYQKNVRSDYVGTMYTFTKSMKIKNNPEDFVTYVPSSTYNATFYNQKFENGFTHDLFFYIKDESKNSWYMTYIAGDNYAVKIQSNKCKNGRKLVIFKDSYGNPIAPFLLESFEEIYVVDMRKFELNSIDFIQQNGITDVLFSMCTFSATGSSVNKYIDIISKQ